MGDLHQEFLGQTISHLEALQIEFLNNANQPLSEDFLRRFFRRLHTIKGTSNTFNFRKLAELAHEIENLVQAVQNNQIIQNQETDSAFRESFRQILLLTKNYQTNHEIIVPQNFISKIRGLIPDFSQTPARNILERLIPTDLIAKLSLHEKNLLEAALENGKTFYLLEVTFNITTFYEDFKMFKQTLNAIGEFIAVTPTISQNPELELSFQIFFVSSLSKSDVEKITDSFSVKIEQKTLTNDFSDDLRGLIERIIAEGERIANILNKKVSFEVSLDEIEMSGRQLILINEITSHLIRNAVDHAIETTEERIANGKNPAAVIIIKISKNENLILLEVMDDGKGIDIEKIISQAREKNLISSDTLNEKEALDLIFSPGFSTSKTVSEISGRGVGLDAVKELVEKSNGRIKLQTELGKGTTFSVYLPQN